MFDTPALGLPVIPDTRLGRARLDVLDVSLSLGGTNLLSGLNFSLSATGCTIVMGPNGAGKSLLLKLLHGLIEPSAGRVLWDGEPPTKVRERQSLVTQKPVLLRRSALQNLEFVLHMRGLDRSRADELLEMVGLGQKAQTLARSLSGGEQQRLSLARALATDPEVLFLDEPTASLDPSSALIMENMIARARDAGTRIICVSHSAAQARRIGTDVLFLHKGRLIEQTPVDRFMDVPQSDLAASFLSGAILA